jgi:hypothetical protein
VLEKKINVGIRSGNNIDEQEWSDLTKYILEQKTEFPDFVESDHLDVSKSKASKKIGDRTTGAVTI